jgi:hypothetical protein
VETADVISIIDIVVSIILAVVIVIVIQRKAENQRYFKDHLIQEIKDLRDDYRELYGKLEKGVKPQEIASWFKLTNTKAHDLLNLVQTLNKNIPKNYLKPFQRELHLIISESKEYVDNYYNNEEFMISYKTSVILQRFRQKHDGKFNLLIKAINQT